MGLKKVVGLTAQEQSFVFVTTLTYRQRTQFCLFYHTFTLFSPNVYAFGGIEKLASLCNFVFRLTENGAEIKSVATVTDIFTKPS